MSLDDLTPQMDNHSLRGRLSQRMSVATLHPAEQPDPTVATVTNQAAPSTNLLASSLQLASLPMLTTPAGVSSRQPRRHRWRTVYLVIFDVLMINIALLLAYFLHFDLFKGIVVVGATDMIALLPFQLTLTVVMLGMIAVRGMYSIRPNTGFLRQASLFFFAATTCFALFSVYEFYFQSGAAPVVAQTHAIGILTWILAAIIPLCGRLGLAWCIGLGYRWGIGRTRILVIGSGRTGKLIMQHLAAAHSLGYQIAGFIHDLEAPPVDFGRFKALGVLDDAERVILAEGIGEVIVAMPSAQYQHIAQCIAVCERHGVRFRLVPDLHELSLTRVDLATIEGIPMITMRRIAPAGWQLSVKRMIDLVGATLGLVVGFPVWLLIAILIRLDSAGPVIYSQERVGLHGRTFTSFKFRSMHVGSDAKQADLAAENRAGRGLFKLRHDPRCTRIGSWLRRMSLDEIPQLWNVVRGDMSLIGPRPPLPAEVTRYEEWEKRRFEMPPGLTGLWQVRGRSNITFDEMVLMDLYYIENWSLRLDMQLLLKTIPVVVFSRGAY